jgi:hypothetical protein
MPTIDDLRDRLRIELHDEDAGAYRWEDETLDRHLLRATRELSFVWPHEQKTTLATTAGSRNLSLSTLTDLVRVYAVEFPVGRYPASYVAHSVFAGTLTMLTDQAPGDAEDVDVYWGGVHTLDGSTSTLPTVAEDVVVTGAAGYAAVEWASFATNRANVGGPEVVRQYLDWGERQLRRFRESLREMGDRARVRPSSLYAAAGEAASQSVVRWEGPA